MPDTHEIERRIDKNVAGAVPVAAGAGGAMTIAPRNAGELMEFAKMMAVAGDCIRPAFRNNPGACLAMALQAFRWGADPFAVANKAYVTKNKAGESQVAYESQLIHAIVISSRVLAKRLRTTYTGEGQSRRCIVTGWIRGEDEPFEYESPPISGITVKNSPLWTSDPDQQLAYYASRAWARRFVPEVLLGIYTTDEVEGEIIDMQPATFALQESEPAETETSPLWEVVDHTGHVYTFERVENAVEACRKILIAVANDPHGLATAWENNAAFIDALARNNLDAALSLERLYAELSPPTTEQASRQDAEEPPGEAEHAAELGRPDTETSTAPLSQAGTTPEPTAGSPEPMAATQASSTGGHGPTAPTASPSNGQQTAEKHDKWWDGLTLKIDPPPVRGGGSLTNLDWKVWPVLIQPRIRQAWSTDVLDRLWADNADNMGRYETACGVAAREELVAVFEAAAKALRLREGG